MEKLIYDETLKNHLALLKRGSELLSVEDGEKTVEHFKAQIELMRNLLRIAEYIVSSQNA